MPLTDLFAGPLRNTLSSGEIVTEIRIPTHRAGSRSCYIKLSPRQTLDLAVVGVAVFLQENGGACEEIRIGLGAVGPTPMRALAAESALRGTRLTPENIDRAARAAAEECSPRDSIRGSAAYRRDMVGVLVKKAIRKILAAGPSGTAC